MSSSTPPPMTPDEDSMSHDESSIEASSSDMSSSANKPSHLKRGGTVRGKSITGRMSKFEDTTTKSSQKLAVIGAPLSLLIDFDGQSRTLPLILKNCMDALRDDEAILKSSTLFRTSPGQEIAEIETKFQSPNLSVNMLLYDANTTANFLLHWLSKLPECLLTNSKYSKFSKVAAIEDSAKSERKLARVVKSLPQANRNALQYLLIFLRELQTHENENKLTTSTLASIFGPVLHRRTQSEEDSDADASSGLSQGEGDAPPSLTNQSASIQVVYRLLSGYATIFAELILEDKEFIPEDQLNEEVVKAKRKGNTLIRSNSQSIDKPLQRKMVVSSSAENISIHPANSAGSSAVSPTVTTKVNISSSTSVMTSAPAHASPTASPATTPVGSPATTHKPRSTSNGSDDAPEKEKEKEKKGFKSTLRKLGLVGKDKKDKSPGRNRSGSASSRPSDPPLSGPTSSTSFGSGNGQLGSKSTSPTAVLGMAFELLLEVPDGNKPRIIPNILRDCFEYLQAGDRTKEFGVFRESGSFTEKARLKDAYDHPNVRIDLDGSDGFTVAALAKDWLRDLPECLLTEALYSTFKEALDETAEDASETSRRLTAAIAQLSAPRRTCLHYMMHFFKTNVVAYQKENKMGESNVGIVIGPCLHRKAKPTPEELMDPCHNQIVTHMLTHYDDVFGQWVLNNSGSHPRSPKELSVIHEGDDSEADQGERSSDEGISSDERASTSTGTIWKKALDLEKVTSVLDEINRKMATPEPSSAGSTGSVPGESSPRAGRSGSMPTEQFVRDGNVSPSKAKDKEEKRKRKGSGIFDMWDRFKEEAGGSGRRRSNTTSSDVAPFQEGSHRTKITRSTSTKVAPTSPKESSTPTSGEPTTPTSASGDSSGALVSPSSKKSTVEGVTGSSTSPKVSPRHETRRTSSTSNLTVRTISSGSLQASSTVSPPASPTPQFNLALGGAGTSDTSATTAVQTPLSPLESPASFGVAVEPSARKKAKRSSRLRELSTGSTKAELPPASPAALVSMLPPEQLDSWLSDNGYGDIVPKLKGTNGKQLVAFSKADLRSEFGIRGVSLWNDVHHPVGDLSARTQDDIGSSALSSQVAILSNKVDELLVKLTIQQQQHQAQLQQQLQLIQHLIQGNASTSPIAREPSPSMGSMIPFHVVQQGSKHVALPSSSDSSSYSAAATGAAASPTQSGWRRSDISVDSPISINTPPGSAPSTPTSSSEPVKRFGLAPEAPSVTSDEPATTEISKTSIGSDDISDSLLSSEKTNDESTWVSATGGVSAEEVAVGVMTSSSLPSEISTTGDDAATSSESAQDSPSSPLPSSGHVRYPTHDAPPIPESSALDETITTVPEPSTSSSADSESTSLEPHDSCPQIEIVLATPRQSSARLDIPPPSSTNEALEIQQPTESPGASGLSSAEPMEPSESVIVEEKGEEESSPSAQE